MISGWKTAGQLSAAGERARARPLFFLHEALEEKGHYQIEVVAEAAPGPCRAGRANAVDAATGPQGRD